MITIFLSYAWDDMKYADFVDAFLSQHPKIEVLRDKRHLNYKDSLTDFMNRARETDYVLMLVGDNYLRSRNCLYEVLQVYKEKDYKKRMFPVILQDLLDKKPCIYDTEKVVGYYTFWKDEERKSEELLSSIDISDLGDLSEKQRILSQIKTNINKFLGDLQDWKLDSYEKLKNEKFKIFFDAVGLDTLPDLPKVNQVDTFMSSVLLDDLLLTVNTLNERFEYTPIRFILDQYPFKTKNGGRGYYHNYALVVDNKKLITFFEQIANGYNDLESGITNVENYKTKLDTICLFLHRHRITHIGSLRSAKEVKIYLPEVKRPVVSIISLIDDFNYKEALTKVRDKLNSENVDELLDYAYVAYKLANDVLSLKYLLKLYTEALNQKKTYKQYLALHNIDALTSTYLRIDRNSTEAKPVLKAVQELAPKSKIKELTKQTNKDGEIFMWMHKNMYYHDNIAVAYEKLRSITDHYYLSMQAGASHNNKLNELGAKFEQFYSFITSNRVFFEHFSNMSEFGSLLIEGILAQLAIPETGGTRLEHIDDYALALILEFAKTNDIWKHKRRYKLDKIKYSPTSVEKEGVQLLNKILDGGLSSSTEEVYSQMSFDLKRDYTRILLNTISIVSILENDDDYVIDILEKIVSLLEQETFIRAYDTKYITNFIHLQHKKLSTDQLVRLVSLAFSNEKYHDSYTDIFDVLAAAFDTRQETFTLNATQSDIVLSFLEKYFLEKERQGHPQSLFDLINANDDAVLSLRCESLITDSLTKEMDIDIFCTATITGVIPLNKDLFDAALQAVSRLQPRQDISFVGFRGDRHRDIEALVNLALKHHVNLKTKDFKLIKDFDIFYSWLLDLDNFDYSQFDPVWVTENATCYYCRHYFSSQPLKKALEKSMDYTTQPRVKDMYLSIYVTKTWVKSCEITESNIVRK